MRNTAKNYRFFDDWLKEKLKDQNFHLEYEKAQTEHAPIRAIIKARMKKGMTQSQVAKKMGTTQSAISRIEAGRSSPTIPYLQRLADALGARLEIKFHFH